MNRDSFINDNFLLESEPARQLYRECADMPIIDYHNHLSAKEIYEDFCYDNITQAWLGGDHYKWRIMRACGYSEDIVSGGADDYQRFLAYAKSMSMMIGNPLYHWSHLELARYFGIYEVLNENSAESIYARCNALLTGRDYSVRNLLARMKVELLCTTDDPIDSLEYHQKLAQCEDRFRVLPTWRPDKAMAIESDQFGSYIATLSDLTEIKISSLDTLLAALQLRLNHFKANGCIISDHGLSHFHAVDYCDSEIDTILLKALDRKEKLNDVEIEKYKSAMLYSLLKMNHSNGLVQQLHQGPLRNQNSVIMQSKGVDMGCDSFDDRQIASGMGRLLDRLHSTGSLSKTIAYNLNPKDGETMVSMLYNFNDGSVAGKMQYGAAWWFLDTKRGMEEQLDILASFGVLGLFVGMLTDSRSYLSFTRHEYFRRILCNYLGSQIEKGLLPRSEMDSIAAIAKAISYENVKRYLEA